MMLFVFVVVGVIAVGVLDLAAVVVDFFHDLSLQGKCDINRNIMQSQVIRDKATAIRLKEIRYAEQLQTPPPGEASCHQV